MVITDAKAGDDLQGGQMREQRVVQSPPAGGDGQPGDARTDLGQKGLAVFRPPQAMQGEAAFQPALDGGHGGGQQNVGHGGGKPFLWGKGGEGAPATDLHLQADFAQAFLKVIVGRDRHRVAIRVLIGDAAGQRLNTKSERRCRKKGIE
jgi:hypothetical protein